MDVRTRPSSWEPIRRREMGHDGDLEPMVDSERYVGQRKTTVLFPSM